MSRRITWFIGGAVAGATGVGVAKRKVKAKAAELSPGKLAKGAIHRVRESVTEGRRAMRAREAELWSRISGTHAGTLADDLDPNDVVIVDGEPIEPGKVIVLRQPGESDRIRRRRS